MHRSRGPVYPSLILSKKVEKMVYWDLAVIDRLEAFEDRNGSTARIMVAGLVALPLLFVVSSAGHMLWTISASFSIGVSYMEGLGLLYIAPLPRRRKAERGSASPLRSALLALVCAAGIGTLVCLAFTGPLNADLATAARLSGMGLRVRYHGWSRSKV